MKNDPLISVIMPVYNTAKYLRESIESILNQTYANFEFFVFDDGSTDSSKEIIQEYAKKDKRIIPFYSDKNIGYVTHLNKGIEQAKGEFIARMDSDDIALPTRFEIQLKYLLESAHIDIVGSAAILINEEGDELRISYQETDPAFIKWALFFYNPLFHPSLLIRKIFFEKNGVYDITMQPAEDRDMWLRGFYNTEFSNIHEPLIKYRVHSQSISNAKQQIQISKSESALLMQYRKFLGIDLPSEYISFFREFRRRDVDISLLNGDVLFSTIRVLKKKFFKANKSKLTKATRKKINKDTFTKLLYIGVTKMKQKEFSGVKVLCYLAFIYPILFSLFIFKKIL